MHWFWRAAKRRLTFIRRHPLWVALILVMVFVLGPAADRLIAGHRATANIVIPWLMVGVFTGVMVLILWRYHRSRQPGYCPSCGHKLQVRLVEYCPECGWMDMHCSKCGHDLSDISEPRCPECGKRI
jgi:predicted RNA-binding Zn-ribbon protein involved in translation (DUF1610 family)